MIINGVFNVKALPSISACKRYTPCTSEIKVVKGILLKQLTANSPTVTFETPVEQRV